MSASATRTRIIPRPADAPADTTGRLVDVDTGEVVAYGHGPWHAEAQKDIRGWVLRWRTGRARRGLPSVRYERYDDSLS